jgi:hypothetical protein
VSAVPFVIINQNSTGIWDQAAEYLCIRKRDPGAPRSQWMNYIHEINRISIFMFLLALVLIAVKAIFFKGH